MKRDLIIEPPSVIDLVETIQLGNAYYVSPEQPISINKAVEKMSKYFKTEGDYSFLQYCAYEKKPQKTTDAYIWVDEDWDDRFAIGACVFSQMNDVGENGQWALQWIWIHPFYRDKGVLSGAWPHFEEKYGTGFQVEPPISKSMMSFLKNRREIT